MDFRLRVASDLVLPTPPINPAPVYTSFNHHTTSGNGRINIFWHHQQGGILFVLLPFQHIIENMRNLSKRRENVSTSSTVCSCKDLPQHVPLVFFSVKHFHLKNKYWIIFKDGEKDVFKKNNITWCVNILIVAQWWKMTCRLCMITTKTEATMDNCSKNQSFTFLFLEMGWFQIRNYQTLPVKSGP